MDVESNDEDVVATVCDHPIGIVFSSRASCIFEVPVCLKTEAFLAICY